MQKHLRVECFDWVFQACHNKPQCCVELLGSSVRSVCEFFMWMVSVDIQEKLPGRDFSFWKWFWANMNLVRNYVCKEWQQGCVTADSSTDLEFIVLLVFCYQMCRNFILFCELLWFSLLLISILFCVWNIWGVNNWRALLWWCVLMIDIAFSALTLFGWASGSSDESAI